jgi:hypothetical protein
MSTSEIEEIKSNLIEWIKQLSDPDMLNLLESLRLSTTEGDWWEELTEVQKQQINEGLEDAENGRVISSEEFWRRLKSG